MHILGLCNGSPGGNSEILLKIALSAAQAQNPTTTTVAWIQVSSVVIPKNPAPLDGTIDNSMGANKSASAGVKYDHRVVDDRAVVRNAILEADAIIVSSATYNHQPPGSLKALVDRIGGPYLDATFTRTALERKRAGDPKYANFQCDERLLKPRILGFLGTGGAGSEEQFTQLLSTMHLYFYSLHARVVDQYVANGFSNAGAVLADADVVARTKQLGVNIASQLGKSFDEAEYLGLQQPGSCPNCHLSTIELLRGPHNAVQCTTCGTTGQLVVQSDGRILPEWEAGSIWSCQTSAGKTKHWEDITTGLEREATRLSGIQEEKKRWQILDLNRIALPSDELEI